MKKGKPTQQNNLLNSTPENSDEEVQQQVKAPAKAKGTSVSQVNTKPAQNATQTSKVSNNTKVPVKPQANAQKTQTENLAKRESAPQATKTNGHTQSGPKNQNLQNKLLDFDSLSESEDVDSDEEVKKPVKAPTKAPVKAPVKNTPANSNANVQKQVKAPIQVQAPRKASQASKKSSVHEDEEIEQPVPVQKKVKSQTVTPAPQAKQVLSKTQVPAQKTQPKAKPVVQEFDEEEEEEDFQQVNDVDDEPIEEVKPVKSLREHVQQQDDNTNQQSNEVYEIYIAGLPFSATQDDVWNYFNSCENIFSVRIMERTDGKPSGKAFIKFSSQDSMTKALKHNGSQMNGRTIIVEPTRSQGQSKSSNSFPHAQQNTTNQITEASNIIIRNLAFGVDENKLRNVFSGCGNIKAIRVMLNEEGRSKGFGFVDFYDIPSARNALAKNGERLEGRPMNIEYSLPRVPGGYQGKPGQGPRNGGYSGARQGYMANFGGQEVNLE